jgi:uncharacterized membrane protein
LGIRWGEVLKGALLGTDAKQPVPAPVKNPKMRVNSSGFLLDQSFRFSIALKGIHALLEMVLGIAVLTVSPQTMNRFALTVLHPELSEDPNDFFATHLLKISENFANGGTRFASFYLLSHGLVKIVLVVELFRNKLWAYPTMIVVLTAFVCYQVYRFSLTHSLAMILLTFFDLIVILLTWLEYAKRRSYVAASRA